MKFVHAADIHLDSPLSGLERYEGAPVEGVRGATRGALRNLVELCLAEEVDFLLIAGDVYDGDWKDYNTGLFFVSQMARLAREGIGVGLIRGNHDAASQITKNLRLPEGVFELDTKNPETRIFENLGVAIHGRGYPKRDVTEDISADYPDAVRDLFNVGLLHTAIDGREGHDLYAPCSVEGLISKGYEYWALGHVHKREALSKDPWIVFPGNLQGRHARETGPKGATLVSVEDGAVISVEHRELDVVRWVVCDIDCGNAASGHEVVDLVHQEVAAEVEAASDRTLAVRVKIVGTSKAHKDLCRDPEHWINQIRSAVLDLGSEVSVEKILFHTRTPIDLDALLKHDDPVAGLLRSLRELRGDPDRLRDLLKEFGDLKNKLPAEYRQLDHSLDFGDPASLEPLLDDVEQLLVPRLLDAKEEP